MSTLFRCAGRADVPWRGARLVRPCGGSLARRGWQSVKKLKEMTERQRGSSCRPDGWTLDGSITHVIFQHLRHRPPLPTWPARSSWASTLLGAMDQACQHVLVPVRWQVAVGRCVKRLHSVDFFSTVHID